jgi:hypothetical protein
MDNLKILGQSAPAATTSTDLYTVPASRSTTVSTLVVCNRAATSATFRVSAAIAGAALANQQYLFYDQVIDGNSTYSVTIGMTLATTDKIRVYASTANLSFNLFGVEVQ